MKGPFASRRPIRPSPAEPSASGARHRASRRLARSVLSVALALTVLSTRVLAHPDHEAHDDGSSLALPALLLGVGGALVVVGLALDRRSDLPRQYAHGLIVGGATAVLVVVPLLWWF